MRRILIYISIILLIFTIFSNCGRKDNKPIQIKFKRLSDHLNLLTGGGANVLASVGKDGLLLVDTKLPSLTNRILVELEKEDLGPKRFVVDTHWHPDHVIGNKSWSKAGAVIIAHKNARKRMCTEQYSSFWNERIPPSEKEALPIVTFQQSMTLYFNNDKVYIFHQPGHTDGDAVVYFRKSNVIHTGDIVFNGILPNASEEDGGSINLQIEAVKRILTMINDDTKIIVGHGPMMSRKDLEECNEMLIDIRNQIRDHIEAGHTLEQIIAQTHGKV